MSELANPHAPTPPHPLYACVYRLPSPSPEAGREDAGDGPRDRAAAGAAGEVNALAAIAQECSPRYEMHGDDLVVIDVAGLQRLLGSPPALGDELRRAAAARGLRAHVAIAPTQTAARILALAQPGLTIVPRGAESGALAPLGIEILQKLEASRLKSRADIAPLRTSEFAFQIFQRWGVNTLGELAGLPAADLVSRLGRSALMWQAMARGEDIRPLVPTLDEERFESTLELEWPLDQLEPLSFVLTRLLEPLSIRLERRDRGAAVLHVLLGLVTRETYARRLELSAPMREVRALRTIALLDLESHPPSAAIDRVTLVVDPTPGRVLQHTLFTRAHPTPEQLSTLLARLGAVMGQDRIGTAVAVDTYRPGAFELKAFATLREPQGRGALHDRAEPGGRGIDRAPDRGDDTIDQSASRASSALKLVSALRRCRQPVPARVAVTDGRPVRVASDRRGFTGGAVVQLAGPWRTSGHWWEEMEPTGQTRQTGQVGRAGESMRSSWNREEWEVALTDGAVYRVFHDRQRDAWFIEAIID